jgi:hypothetical protein
MSLNLLVVLGGIILTLQRQKEAKHAYLVEAVLKGLLQEVYSYILSYTLFLQQLLYLILSSTSAATVATTSTYMFLL